MKEGKEMPRLVGQQSNTGTNVLALIIFVSVISILLEYLGAIDIIPGFGREGRYFQLQSQPINKSLTKQDNQ
jgi:hypothetical protein